MDSKLIIIFFLVIVIVGLLTNFILTKIMNRQGLNSCVNQGYVPVEDANQIINLSNKLIDTVNKCHNGTDSLPPLSYYRGVN